MPAANIEGLLAIGFFLSALVIAKAVNNISAGKWPGGTMWVAYLRMLLGFLLTGAAVFAFCALFGIDIISR